MTRLLMVCMGNICRSPMACVVTRHLAAAAGRQSDLTIDAAGTDAFHAGQRMDERARAALSKRNYSPGKERCRQVQPEDFERYDLILAMDEDNLATLQRRCPGPLQHKLRLFLSYAPNLETTEVPDPYYGNQAGFERVLDLCEAGARALLTKI